jgi:hypothetical protein
LAEFFFTQGVQIAAGTRVAKTKVVEYQAMDAKVGSTSDDDRQPSPTPPEMQASPPTIHFRQQDFQGLAL